MSDEARESCPQCEPAPEGLFVIVYCANHIPDVRGTGDLLANPLATPSPGIAEGGVDGAAWCALIHREASP